MNNNSQSAALSLEPHDSRYEWKTVLLLALKFGLVWTAGFSRRCSPR